MRTPLVVVVALVALTAGCGALDQPARTAAATSDPGETVTDDCTADLLLTDDGSDRVTPRPLAAERPELTPEAVARFAREHERSFAHNHELDDRTRDVTVELQGTTVEAVDGGYAVRIHVWTRTTVRLSTATDGDETAVRESYYDAHYYVSERTLRRAETDRHGSRPDTALSESGVTLVCWG